MTLPGESIALGDTEVQQRTTTLAEISQPVRPDWGGVAAGVIFLALAALSLYGARDLPGTGGFDFGPGAFPRAVSLMMGIMGALVLIEGFVLQAVTIRSFAIVPGIVVIVTGLAFVLMIRPLGLVVTSIASAAFIGVYTLRKRPVILVLVLVISAAALVAGKALMNLPYPLWPNLWESNGV
jgi:putative tricarboxylic transport membrane protein